MILWPEQTIGSTKLYTVDWIEDVKGNTISSSSWYSTPGDLTFATSAISSKKTTTLISGGIEGCTYVVTNKIVCSDGQTLEKQFSLRFAVTFP